MCQFIYYYDNIITMYISLVEETLMICSVFRYGFDLVLPWIEAVAHRCSSQ